MLTSARLSPRPHGFTGVAEGNFRPGVPGAPDTLVRRLGGEGPLRIVSQVHGARVVDVALADGHTEADAIVSADPAVVIAVRVADCVPILLSAPGAVAAVHAGWRSTAGDIVRATVVALERMTGAAPSTFVAAIGPAIGACCYEVGPEVIEGVGRIAIGQQWLHGRHVDLREANAGVLRSLGVAVDILGPCTRCDPAYWSHRRDGAAAGRQVGAIRAA